MINKKVKDLFFHEDDYLQIEIISKRNFFEQNRNISELSYKYVEQGFTDINRRKSKKIITSTLSINVKDLQDILESRALVEFKNIYTGHSSSSILKKNIIAYGFEDYAILFDYQGNFVQNIWMDFTPKLKIPFPSYANLTKTLNAIGVKYDMILIDWNEEKIVDLKSNKKIIDYLNSL